MDLNEIRVAVLEMLKSIAPEMDADNLKPDQPLRRQVDLDSMDWLNVIAGLHEKLQVDIPESDYGRLTTLDAIVTCVASNLAARDARPEHAAATDPARFARTHQLLDGRQVSVRPIRKEDAQLEADFVRHLSRESRYDRFMVSMNELSPSKLKYLTEVDSDHHVALVAMENRDGKEVEVGVSRYVIAPGTTCCEFAIAVDDAWHGSGLAGALMGDLIEIARARGVTEMEGFVLAVNHRMLKFARQLGFTQHRDPEDRDTVHVVRML
ncbi:MAG: GCN5-related N-acetyltransferase [Rhodocyclaceae bacterium]|nr:MAG: GCN5-related N-acetyltransferase [Rhodocyclaceae bacterium]TNC99568.1 MAG: GCN5-related N-acetyltransferase [Rhodocyclaceae bacterium]